MRLKKCAMLGSEDNIMYKWNSEKEALAIKLRSEGVTYNAIAKTLETTHSSVKHKIRRIQQSKNMDRYKHTKEKVEQIEKIINDSDNNILETNCGFGSLSEFYNNFGTVQSYDIKKEKVDFVSNLDLENVKVNQADSHKEIIKLLARKKKFNIVDIDPYGMPSRYFPHVFGLIERGFLFLTFPMMGVAQINKITIRHYQAFWGIDLIDKPFYIDKIISKLKDYAFMHGRQIEVIDVIKIDRIYRLAVRVDKKSMLDIVGLKVNRQKT